MPASLERRVDALDAEVSDLRRRSDDRIDERMALHRREWREELAEHLAAHKDDVDRKLAANRDALVKALGETEGRVAAKLDALAERRQVPPWLERLTVAQVVTLLGAVGGLLTVATPAVLAVIAALQGHPTAYVAPVPVPLQIEPETP